MMIEFTDYRNPDQKALIDPKNVQAIIAAGSGDGALVLVAGNWISVKESPEQVREKMVANQ
jgi:uncharacterized protein YlzI (FlbEa/FlbD family)